MLVLALTSQSRCLTPVLFSNLFPGCICLPSFPSFFSPCIPWPLALHSALFYPLSPHSVSSICDNKLGEITTLFLPFFPRSICLSSWANFHSEINSVWLSFFFFPPGSKVHVLCVRCKRGAC